MKPIQKILVPLDFSKSSTQVLQLAVDLAQRYSAALDLIYVYQPVATALPEGYVLMTPSQLAEILSEFERELAIAKKRTVTAGVSQVETAVLQGYPSDEILHRAEERHADLIVMGTHGRSGAKRVLLGSVAENVLRAAKCPVLVTRGD